MSVKACCDSANEFSAFDEEAGCEVSAGLQGGFHTYKCVLLLGHGWLVYSWPTFSTTLAASENIKKRDSCMFAVSLFDRLCGNDVRCCHSNTHPSRLLADAVGQQQAVSPMPCC
jgi:hypothetical protein